MAKDANKDKMSALDEALKAIEKTYGKGAVMRLGERRHVEVDAIPSGSLLLDYSLGVGGYPKGRIIEIYGPESSGKTTLALHAIAEAQKWEDEQLLLMLNIQLTQCMLVILALISMI